MIHRLIGGFAAVLVLLASCGEPSTPAGSGPSPTSTAASEFPVTIDTARGSLTIDERPTRIVSLSPTATEMLFAIGADEQVIAVDDQSNYPADAPTTDLSGYEPNVEAIASYDPDLVVYATEPGDLGSSLEDLGITTLLQPAAATLKDAYAQIEQLGLATGNAEGAQQVVDGMKGDIEAITDRVGNAGGLTFYHELDDTYYSVTSSTFIGQLYSLVGLRNIADQAKGAGGGYPQLSAEYIIQADPDLIFLADTKCCGQSARTVAKRPGWDGISAIRDDDVVPLDDDVASRWGPRVVDLLRRIANAVSRVEEGMAA